MQSQFVAVPAINEYLISHTAEVQSSSHQLGRNVIVHPGYVKGREAYDRAIHETLVQYRCPEDILNLIFKAETNITISCLNICRTID